MNIPLRPAVLAFLMQFVGLFVAGVPVAGDGVAQTTPEPGRAPESPGFHQLIVWFIDAATIKPTTVRVGVFDVDGQPVVPEPRREYLFQDLGRSSYFYCEHSVRLQVMPGPVKIRVMKGFEFEPEELDLVVQADTAFAVLMHRWTDARRDGWFSGDTHTHMTHGPVVYELTPADMMRVIEGEDLHFLNSMDKEEHFTGGAHPLSGSQRVLSFSREYRNPHFGHLSLLGLSEWVSTPEGCWDTTGVACGKILNSVVAEAVHEQPGAIVIATHPFPTEDYMDLSSWPGGGVARGLPLDLPSGSVDAIDVLCYSHLLPPKALDEYTQVLNAGFRVPASAGTDATLSRGRSFPPGGYRVYAKVGDGPADFSSRTWIDAVKAGRSFVSNAPLIESFRVGGGTMGDVVTTHESVITGSVSARCAVPMGKVDIITERGVVATLLPSPGGDGRHIHGEFTVRADSTRWVVARVTGNRPSWYVVDASGLFARTNPVYLDYLDHAPGFVPPQLAAAENHFEQRLTQLVQLYDRSGYFPGDARALFDAAVNGALNYYRGLSPDAPAPFALLGPAKWSNVHGGTSVATTFPTMVWEASVDDDPGSDVTYRLTYGPDSTFATGARTVALSDTFYTVPSQNPLVDLNWYYWKVTATDDTGLETRGSPPLMSFVVDVSAVGAEAPDVPADWVLGPAVPNPFNPETSLPYQVPLGAGFHTVSVVDVRGARVRTLFAGTRPAARYTLRWDGTNADGARVSSGVYFIRLTSPRGGLIASRKVVVIK